MKRLFFVLLTVLVVFGIVSCSSNAQKDEEEKHKIGVAVYDVTDDEVIAFRDYLTGYIQECFPEVEFYYSYAIRSAKEERSEERRVGKECG